MKKKYIILLMSLLWITEVSAQIVLEYNKIEYEDGATIVCDRYDGVVFNILDATNNYDGLRTDYKFENYSEIFGTEVVRDVIGNNGTFRLKNPCNTWCVVLNYSWKVMKNSDLIFEGQSAFTFVTTAYNLLKQDCSKAKKITGGCIAPYVIVDHQTQLYIPEGIGPTIDGIPFDKNSVYAYRWQYSDNKGTTWSDLEGTAADLNTTVVEGRWFRRQANVMGTWYNSNICEVRNNKYGNNNYILKRRYITGE
ncbi:hypothetical protein [Xiashengella succiniciproducens]|jgi:hypothetical protein|uniref:Uncharacterized protein n=1 Tax=Xiashengella succiniciproducens TaxID=2949635 RepID=A0A9J6ZST3_9BACT|nr:hypothetical protein [Alkaliflexus sp. Ai-910]URW80619.1 hypothetical protein M9189_04550 [Alkaliflexus sp. Ai-910]